MNIGINNNMNHIKRKLLLFVTYHLDNQLKLSRIMIPLQMISYVEMTMYPDPLQHQKYYRDISMNFEKQAII